MQAQIIDSQYEAERDAVLPHNAVSPMQDQ